MSGGNLARPGRLEISQEIVDIQVSRYLIQDCEESVCDVLSRDVG